MGGETVGRAASMLFAGAARSGEQSFANAGNQLNQTEAGMFPRL